MTTPWIVPRMWEGETVAVLASGPSMDQALADSVKQHRRICARRSFRFAPDADMLISLDGPADAEFWRESRDFGGLRIVGFDYDAEPDVMVLNLPHERITLGEGHVVEIRNNGLAAIRVAAMTGAASILLLGFDRGLYEKRENNVAIGLIGLEEGLDALIAELRARGIEIERV